MTRTRSRGQWLRLMHSLHWVSSAVCLVGMILFSLTGITLNHAADIDAEPRVVTREVTLPLALADQLRRVDAAAPRDVPDGVSDWLEAALGVEPAAARAEWSADELYLSFARPGGDAWLAVELANGEVLYESTERGWIAWFNDLHKGRDTGVVWSWFIDVFAVATLVFAGTGLVLLYLHARHRRATWRVTGLGLVLPWLLIYFFVP